MPRHHSARRYALQVTVSTLLTSAWAYGQTEPRQTEPRQTQPSEAGQAASPSASVSPAEIEAARTHATAAFAALDEARDETAITEFTEALRLMDVPTLRVGRADALVRSNRWLEAHADYDAAIKYVLKPGDSEAFEQSQKEASVKLDELKTRMPRLRIVMDVESAQVKLDDRPSYVVVRGQAVALDPGAHRVLVVVPDGSFTHTVQAREGETAVVAANARGSLQEAVTADDTSPVGPEPAGNSNTALLVSGSITAVLAASAVATGVWWMVERSNFVNGDLPYEEKVRAHRDLETLAWVNTGLTAAAVAAAGVTAYFWLSPQFEPQPDRSGSAAPSPSGLPRGLSLVASGHF